MVTITHEKNFIDLPHAVPLPNENERNQTKKKRHLVRACSFGLRNFRIPISSPPKRNQERRKHSHSQQRFHLPTPISPKPQLDSRSQIKPRTSGRGAKRFRDLVVEGEALAERRLRLLDVAVVDLGLRRARRRGARIRLLQRRRLPLYRGRGGRRWPVPCGAHLAPAVPLRRRHRCRRRSRCVTAAATAVARFLRRAC